MTRRSEQRPLRWRAPQELDEKPPTGTILKTDAYDWWHFRRLGAWEPGLYARLIRSRFLIPIAFDVYAMLYKPRIRIRGDAPRNLTAGIGALLETRGDLARMRQRTVLNEWATVVALPLLLDPLLEALKRARSEKRNVTQESEAEFAFAARDANNLAVARTTALLKRRTAELARVGRHARDRAERHRLETEIRQTRTELAALKNERAANEEAAAAQIAAGADPLLNEAAARACAGVEEAMQVIDSVRLLFRENDKWGRDQGALSLLPLDAVLTLGRQLQKEASIRKIIELAGRWSVTLKRKYPRGKSTHGRSEVLGITIGGELERLVPSELAMLVHPIYRRVMLARLLERRALTTALKGPALLGRGPVVVIVDTSGSMAGARMVMAKALCLSVALRCWERRRPMHVLTFGSAGEIAETRFLGASDFLGRLNGCLAMAFAGGTDFDGPLIRATEICRAKPWSQADVLFITDGYCEVSSATREVVAQAKRQCGLQLLCVKLASGSGLEEIADASFAINPDAAMDATPEPLFSRLAGRL